MLKKEERQFAIQLAKDSLKHYLTERMPLKGDINGVKDKFGDYSDFLKPLGCFVTLHEDHELRGCIGTIISEEPLYINIIQNAVAAGLRDPRFSPVSEEELSDLHFEISVMGPLTPVKHLDEIEVGVHGLVMRRGVHQGLLLPQVPVEWGWDRKTFLEHTCLKAGLPKDEYQSKETEIYSFTAEVFSEDDV